MSPPLDVAVAFIIFNRPEPARRVFEAIRAARPAKLLVIADGPRPGRAGEEGRCKETRAIIDAVDWPCEVLKNFSEHNMGCAKRVSSGIGWAFEVVPEAIILEDDCLPHPSFFSYCQELLARYRDEPRVMQISGDNFQPVRRTPYSYYFSRYTHVWGWASWRRAWGHYSLTADDFEAFSRSRRFRQTTPRFFDRLFWKTQIGAAARGKIDTWDYQWGSTLIAHEGLAVIPEVNLVTNIGGGADATHTVESNPWMDRASHDIGPLVHPPEIKPCDEADRYTMDDVFNVRALRARWGPRGLAARAMGRVRGLWRR